MVNWLLENKEWLFSGIGLTIIVGISVLIKAVFVKKNSYKDSLGKELAIQTHHNTEIQTYNSEKQSVISDLTPKAIVEAVNSVPPLQRKDLAKHYQGIRVKWSGSVVDIKELGGGHNVLIMLNCNGFDPHSAKSIDIVFTVNPSDYKGLSLMDIDQRITVEGDIEEIGDYVKLANVKLFI